MLTPASAASGFAQDAAGNGSLGCESCFYQNTLHLISKSQTLGPQPMRKKAAPMGTPRKDGSSLSSTAQ